MIMQTSGGKTEKKYRNKIFLTRFETDQKLRFL